MARKPKSVAKPRRPYTTPKLTVHGDLAALTQVKRGNKGDGARKPRTRASGGAA